MPPAQAAPVVDDPVEPPVIGSRPFQAPPNGFHWRVPSRFGSDANRDGITDYHWNDLTRPPEHAGPAETYDPEWVHPKKFPMDFDGCQTPEEAEKSRAGTPTDNTYTWEIPGQTLGARRDCRLVGQVTFPAQGTYRVSLSVTKPDGTTGGHYAQDVRVRDFLIVSIGDSYGSGEGNPDWPQVFLQNNPIFAARWVDRRCHRSADAGAAQAARRIEASDPKTSVTFLSFACSGATIDTVWGTSPFAPYQPPQPDERNPGTGILGPYKGAEEPAPVHRDYAGRSPAWPPEVSYPEYLPSQLEQLKRAVTAPDGSKRPVDSLVVSAGGNDAGFAPVASQCVFVVEKCMGSWVDDRYAPGTLIQLRDRFPQDVAALAAKYDALKTALGATDLPIARTYVTEYPGSTTDDGGAPCPKMLDDVLHPNPLLFALIAPWLLGPLALFAFLWSQTRAMEGEEVAWADQTIAPAINATLQEAAHRNGWTYVDGIGERYHGHGYCASNSYVRRAPESSKLQGGWGPLERAGIHANIKGTLHPNVTGHQMYAEELTPLLANQFAIGSGSAAFSYAERTEASESRRGRAGWLTGRCPLGSGGCTSDAAVITVEAHDASVLRGAGFTVNGRAECPQEMSCTARLVDPSTYRWTFTIAGDGIWRLGFAVSNESGHVSSFHRETKVDLHDPTAAATLESPTAPTTLRVQGDDGHGSGVDQVTFRGLWHGNAPGSTAPGQTVAVDSGGTYRVRFRAVDEAGRAGPEQAQELTLGGPTMSGRPTEPGSGAGAAVAGECTQLGAESGDANNGVDQDGGGWYDGLPVASTTSRTHADAVPARRAVAARARAAWTDSNVNGGNDDCSAGGSLQQVPLNIRPGTSGLTPGQPVTLQATVELSGALVESIDSSDPHLETRARFQARFDVRDPLCGSPCSSGLFHFSASAERDTFRHPGWPDERRLEYRYDVWGNAEPHRHEAVGDDEPAPTPFNFPVQSFTMTFTSEVGARHLVDGKLDVFTQAYSGARTRVAADADFGASLDIRPAPGFEGVEVIHGDPQPNRPPEAVDDAVTVEGNQAATIDVLANDTDPDGHPLTVTEVSAPAHGTATIEPNGSVAYTPVAAFPGRDSFTYTVSDGEGGTDTATVRVRAAGVRTPPADFDGDGRSVPAVFRPPGAVWFERDGLTTPWGTAGDIPVPGDYDGDATTDVAVFRPSNGIWFVEDGPTVAWGTAGDIPVPGDYDGNGTTDMAVFRPSSGLWFVRDGVTTAYGTDGDIPVPGDYDGEGDTDIAVYRPSDGSWFVQGGSSVQWGTSGDIPVPGDYDGDGDGDFAQFRPSNGVWLVKDGPTLPWGTSGDIPGPGDYDGDGTTDAAVFRPSGGYWFIHSGTMTHFGTNGDVPLPLPDAIRRFFFAPL